MGIPLEKDKVSSITETVTISRREYNAMLESLAILRSLKMIELDDDDVCFNSFNMLKEVSEELLERADRDYK